MHTKFLPENLEGKRPFATHKRKWEDIRMNFREIRWEGIGLDSSGSG
jgi:hypothetical protein